MRVKGLEHGYEKGASGTETAFQSDGRATFGS